MATRIGGLVAYDQYSGKHHDSLSSAGKGSRSNFSSIGGDSQQENDNEPKSRVLDLIRQKKAGQKK